MFKKFISLLSIQYLNAIVHDVLSWQYSYLYKFRQLAEWALDCTYSSQILIKHIELKNVSYIYCLQTLITHTVRKKRQLHILSTLIKNINSILYRLQTLITLTVPKHQLHLWPSGWTQLHQLYGHHEKVTIKFLWTVGIFDWFLSYLVA